MSVTLEDLERRLVAVEQELATLRQGLNPTPPMPAPAPAAPEDVEAIIQSIPMLREARKNQHVFAEGYRRFLEELGVTCQPIGAENLQKMLIEQGLDPNSNEFSRGIIEMREE